MNSFVVIEAYDKVYQAQVAKLALEQEGIECFLENETIVSMDWFLSNAVGGIKLQVASVDASKAIRVLQELKDLQVEREHSSQGIRIVCLCKGCKKIVSFDGRQGGRVGSCPKCGRYLDVPSETDESIDPELIRLSLESVPGTKEGAASLLSNRWYLIFEVFADLCFAYFLDLRNAIGFYFRCIEAQGDIFVDANFYANFLWVRSITVLVLITPIFMVFGIPRLQLLPRPCSWLRLAAEGIGLAVVHPFFSDLIIYTKVSGLVSLAHR